MINRGSLAASLIAGLPEEGLPEEVGEWLKGIYMGFLEETLADRVLVKDIGRRRVILEVEA